MSDRKVVPFRRRAPSPAEVAIYRQMTRNWHPEVRQMIFPDHVKLDRGPRK